MSTGTVQALEAIETRVVEIVEASASVAGLLSAATAPGVDVPHADERELLALCNRVLTQAKVRRCKSHAAWTQMHGGGWRAGR
jgi:hypothetical protein